MTVTTLDLNGVGGVYNYTYTSSDTIELSGTCNASSFTLTINPTITIILNCTNCVLIVQLP